MMAIMPMVSKGSLLTWSLFTFINNWMTLYNYFTNDVGYNFLLI